MSSGLLPRTVPSTANSSFALIDTNTLNVAGTANINNLVVANETIQSITTNTVHGNPNLAVDATAVTINGDDVTTNTATQTLTGKTIDSASNSVLIGGTNVNLLVNQDVRTTASPSFAAVTVGGSPVVTESATQTLTGKTLSSIQNTINITSGSLLNTNINNVVNQDVRSSATPTFAQVSASSIKTANIYDQAGGDTANINGALALNTTNHATLSGKTIDSLSNTISVDGTDINDLLDQAVKMTSDVSFQTVASVGTTTSGGNLISHGTLVVDGPKISPLPTTPQLTVGLDTLDVPRVQMWADPAGTLGSLTFGNLDGNSQYEGKLDYDGVTNSFNFYFSGSPSPFINFAASGATIGGSTIATAANAVVLSSKTIDSSANTIQISNSPLSAVNVNLLLNQDVRTTAGPSFQYATFNQDANPFIVIQDNGARNGLLGVASNANGWFSGSSTGDFCISNRTNGAIRLGQGTGASPANFVLSTTACSIVPATTVPRLTQSNYSAVCRYNTTANALVTNVISIGVFANIQTAIALASIPLQNFSNNGNVGVTYTGSLSRRFLISYAVTINTSVSVGHSLQCTINGVVVAASIKSGHSHVGATSPSTTSCSWISLLAPNDQLQLQLANLSSTTDLLAERITFTLNELDF